MNDADLQRILDRLVRLKWASHGTKVPEQLVDDIAKRSEELLTRWLVDVADLHATAGLPTAATFATVLSALLSRAAHAAVVYDMEQEAMDGFRASLEHAREQLRREGPAFRQKFEAARRRAGII